MVAIVSAYQGSPRLYSSNILSGHYAPPFIYFIVQFSE